MIQKWDLILFLKEGLFGGNYSKKIMEKYEPPPFSVVLTFCSLSNNKIKADGACELARALKLNQNLLKLK